MSEYIKQNFISGQILKAEHLNHMEDGIEQLSEGMALKSDIPSDEHINELISIALASFTNAEEVTY